MEKTLCDRNQLQRLYGRSWYFPMGIDPQYHPSLFCDSALRNKTTCLNFIEESQAMRYISRLIRSPRMAGWNIEGIYPDWGKVGKVRVSCVV